MILTRNKFKYDPAGLTVRDLLVDIPYEAGCNNPDRTAFVATAVFDSEASGNVVFARRDGEEAEKRLAHCFVYDGGDTGVIKKGKLIFQLWALCHYKLRHGDNGLDVKIENVKKELRELPESALDKYVEVATRGWWSGG